MNKAEFLKMVQEWDDDVRICPADISEFQEGALCMARWWAEQLLKAENVWHERQGIYDLAYELLEHDKQSEGGG